MGAGALRTAGATSCSKRVGAACTADTGTINVHNEALELRKTAEAGECNPRQAQVQHAPTALGRLSSSGRF